MERLTVYRHFPDDRALASACSQHYWAQHAAPDPAVWQAIADPETRLRTALAAIYAYHRRTERMSLRTVQELPDYPVLREVLAPQFAYWSGVRDVLAAGWASSGRAQQLVQAAVAHAIGFTTWYSLVREQGLDDEQTVELMVGMVRCMAYASRDAS